VDGADKNSGKGESDGEDGSEEETLLGEEKGNISIDQSIHVSKEKKKISRREFSENEMSKFISIDYQSKIVWPF
jgi:hypothetical protein